MPEMHKAVEPAAAAPRPGVTPPPGKHKRVVEGATDLLDDSVHVITAIMGTR